MQNDRVMRHARGFSLAEMAVVVAIGGVLATLATAAFDRQQKDKRTSGEVRTLMQLVDQARLAAATSGVRCGLIYDAELGKLTLFRDDPDDLADIHPITPDGGSSGPNGTPFHVLVDRTLELHGNHRAVHILSQGANNGPLAHTDFQILFNNLGEMTYFRKTPGGQSWSAVPGGVSYVFKLTNPAGTTAPVSMRLEADGYSRVDNGYYQ